MDYNEAMEAVNGKKVVLKEAKQALRTFRKDNDINPDEDISDEKLAKKHAKLVAAIEKAETEVEEATGAAKELKPKVERISKYEYPEGLTTAEKKKFRSKARAAAAKAAKGEGEETPKSKKEKTETPAKETTPKRIKKASVEDED